MDWKRSCSVFGRHGYHHGRLKEALIAAARRLLAERGPQGFTLNEACRFAGVSAAAPYRHFRDRNALIAATAAEGFVAFRASLETAAQSGSRPYDALMRMGEAYLAFARDEPGYYAAMFSSGLPEVGEATGEAGKQSYCILQQTLRSLGADEEHLGDLAVQIWALSHGVAGLAATGAIGSGCGPDDIRRILRTGCNALLRQAGITVPESEAVPAPRESEPEKALNPTL